MLCRLSTRYHGKKEDSSSHRADTLSVDFCANVC